MWTQPATLQREFANQMAVRIMLGATLALIIVLAVPYHPQYWFGWFAPFSVIISMLMFPFQNKNHGILWERFISVTMGVIIGLVCYTLFINSQLLYCISLFLLSLFCMYQVGNHSRWHYGYFLAMIFIVLGISFVFTNKQLVYAFWQFPVTVLIAIFVVVIIDKFRRADTAAQHAIKLAENIRQDFRNLSDDKTIDLSLLSYWKSHLLQTRSELSDQQYQKHLAINYLLQLIAKKHNTFIKHMKLIDNPKAQHFLTVCHQAIINTLKNPNEMQAMHRKLKMTEINFGISGIKDRNIWVCLNDLNLTAEDVERLLTVEQDKKIDINIPSAQTAHTSGFNPAAFSFSLRTMVAVVASLALVYLFHLPGGIQTIIATIVTAGAPNTGASALKMFMRFAGIVIGSLAGFAVLLVIASTQSLILYLLLFAGFVYWMASWSLRSKNYGYVGLQSALLFLIMLSNTGTTAINITLSTERFYGVITGGLIAFVMVLLVVPNRPEKVIAQIFQKVVDQLQSTWKLLHQTEVSIDEINNQLAAIDQNLSSLDEALNQQRFLLTSTSHEYDQVYDLRRLVSLLRQLARLLNNDEYSAKKVQNILSQYQLHFDDVTTDKQPTLSHTISDRFSAKTCYCLDHIFQHWAQFKKYWHKGLDHG
ncbi:MAG: FUSC family protein [Coxiellaceae bacterium]|nr:FUSC family protein [Coxiellaceae bacterium]